MPAEYAAVLIERRRAWAREVADLVAEILPQYRPAWAVLAVLDLEGARVSVQAFDRFPPEPQILVTAPISRLEKPRHVARGLVFELLDRIDAAVRAPGWTPAPGPISIVFETTEEPDPCPPTAQQQCPTSTSSTTVTSAPSAA